MKKFTNRFFSVYGLIACLVIITMSSLPTWGQNNTSLNTNNIPINGTNSVALGFDALKVNTGSANIGIGYRALFSSTTGINNTAIGEEALRSNTIGHSNTANGRFALYLNTTGSNNTAIGLSALQNNTGSFNTANGVNALYSNTTGSSNTANGGSALYRNTTGNNNSANGNTALYSNTSGINNTANGVNALAFNTTGTNNAANGMYALETNTTGSNNTASGQGALGVNTTGGSNTALGEGAGSSSLGSGNIYIGSKAGAIETGSNKLYMGNDANQTILYGDISTGQVLFGKPDATGYSFNGTRTLNVLGGILADSIRVSLSGEWADYVFTEDYQLLAPEALKAYIKTHKHLPGIPTQQQVKKEGIHLAEMNTKLLEKIEELTLYMLNQQEEISTLKEITTKQMALINALEKRIEKMP